MSLLEQNNLRLSVSKCKTFTDCQAKYKFSYILKLPKKTRDYHILGTFVHKVLEDFHSYYINGCTEKLHISMQTAYIAAIKEFKEKLTVDIKKEAYEIIDNYLKNITEEKDIIPGILSVEKKFDFNISENVVLNGMIDRVQRDKDGMLHIADYKTTKNKKYLKNDFLQLLTYAYVMWSEDKSIQKIRGSYILLRHNCEMMTKEFEIDEILQVKQKYEGYAKMIEEERLYRPNPTLLCAYCDFVDVCKDGLDFINKKNNVKHGEMSWK